MGPSAFFLGIPREFFLLMFRVTTDNHDWRNLNYLHFAYKKDEKKGIANREVEPGYALQVPIKIERPAVCSISVAIKSDDFLRANEARENPRITPIFAREQI